MHKNAWRRFGRLFKTRVRDRSSLRLSELCYRRLFESTKDGILILDGETGLVMDVNPFLAELLCSSQEALIGRKIWELGLFEDIISDNARFEDVARKDVTGPRYIRLKTVDGRYVEVECVTSSFIADNQRKVIHFSIRDVMERKRDEERLLHLMHAVNSSGDAIGISDAKGRHIFQNRALSELFGYATVEELQAAGGGAAVIKEPAVAMQMFENIMSGKSWVGELEMVTKSGRVFHAHERADAIKDHDGRIIGLIGIITDITDRKRATVALQASERRFRATIKASPVPTALNDEQQNITFLNSAFVRTFGYSPEDIPTLSDWWPKAYPDPQYRQWVAETWKDHLEVAARTGKAFEAMELNVRCKDGTDKIVLASASPLLDMTFAGEHMVMLYDITDRKRAEESLLDRTRFIESLLKITPGILYIYDLDERRNIFSNMESDKILGYSADEITSMGSQIIPLLMHPDDLPTYLSSVVPRYASARDRELILHKYRMKNKAGEWRWLLSTETIYLRHSDGTPRQIFGIMNDITESKLAEDALASAAHQWQSTFDSTNDAIWVLDQKHRVVRSNRIADQLFPPHRDGHNGTPCWEIVHGTTCPIAECPVERTRNSLRRESIELQIGDRWCQVTADPILDPDMRYGGAVHIMRDITMQKRAETETRKLQAELTQAQKMETVGRLAGGIAHNFNNLMMGVMGYAELGHDELPPDHPAHGYFDKITADAQRAAALTQQLLAFARKQMISPKMMDLNNTISNLLNILIRLVGEKINIVWRPGAGLWHVKLDPAQVEQIMASLCINSTDAISGAGTITIGTSNVTVDQALSVGHPGLSLGEHVLVSLSDTGAGMAREIIEHIFEPFFTTKPLAKGAGLGLATVYGIVKQNGGNVYAESEPGKGTKFTIYLPRAAVPTADDPVAEAKTDPLRGNETVLLVDDESSILRATSSILKSIGYTVLTAEHPDEALRITTQYPSPIHLLITDVIMPGMNGNDLASKLSELRPSIKRIFISGYSADVLAQDGILMDSSYLLTKPFGRAQLASKIREVLTS